MENSKPLVIGGIIVVLLVLGYALYQNSNRGVAEPSTSATSTSEALPLNLNAKHLYKDGVHRFRGVVTTPTPCYNVTAEVIVPADIGTLDNPNPYVIAITTTERVGEVCAQVLTDKDFEVSVKAGFDIPWNVTLNGQEERLNIIEVDREEDLLGPFDFKS